MTGHVYTVASGKGGVGKTTTAINLGAMLAEAGADVVVVDTDLGMANIAGFLDFEMDGATLHDVLAGEANVAAAVYEAPGDVDVLPSSTDIQAFAKSETENLPEVVAALREEYDFVLLDTGAGISYDTMLPLSLADAVLLVTTPDVASVRDTAKTGELTAHVGGTVRGAVLTQRGDDILNADDVEGTLETDILAVVPTDETVPMSIDAGRPLAAFAPNGDAAAAYRDLAGVLAGSDEAERREAKTDEDGDGVRDAADDDPKPGDDSAPGDAAAPALADAEAELGDADSFDADPVHDLIDERIVEAADAPEPTAPDEDASDAADGTPSEPADEKDASDGPDDSGATSPDDGATAVDAAGSDVADDASTDDPASGDPLDDRADATGGKRVRVTDEADDAATEAEAGDVAGEPSAPTPDETEASDRPATDEAESGDASDDAAAVPEDASESAGDTAKAPWEASGADDEPEAVPFEEDEPGQTELGAMANEDDEADEDEAGIFGRIGSLFR